MITAEVNLISVRLIEDDMNGKSELEIKGERDERITYQIFVQMTVHTQEIERIVRLREYIVLIKHIQNINHP